MKQYNGLRWRDGDVFHTYVEDAKTVAEMEQKQAENAQMLSDNQEVNEEFERNKRDVIRLLGYDPFESEKLEDQPLLYSQLIGYLDTGGDGNDDIMRTSSAITIVRGFSQQAKLDDKLAQVMANSSANPTEMKTLLDAKKNLSATISQLAEQSCLSLKHNKNASKGENTWTGKIKKLKDMDLRDAEVNGFDIGTCRGMQQVLEISDASIMKQLSLDESEWSDMVAEQSCLSLKHNKNASKGENTWTGKIKKLKDMDLRDAEVNGFDIGTCRGMQQVLDISDASIMKQLALDESEWSEMVADQRKLIVELQKERDTYKEINRVLLRENLDLRDTLEENDMLDANNLHNLKDLFSPFGETTTRDEEDEEDE